MIGVLLIVVAAVAFLDAVRRPPSQWIEADRNRAFWLVMIVLMNVIGVVAYLIAVVPRFPRGAGTTAAELLKPSSGQER
ncbi:MAG: PLDc N-terminal domain-containing protein [Solirubrobacterales bacterium]